MVNIRGQEQAGVHTAPAGAQHARICHHVLEAGLVQVAAGLQP